MISGLRSVVTLLSVSAGITACSTSVADVEEVTTVQIGAAVKEDARLEKPVSLSSRATSLKAVLDRFSEQAGVSISIDERDPASSYSVMVECSKIPAGRMMDALYSVLSIRKGEWAWMRIGKPGAYRYTLRETPWAKNRTDTYHSILNGLLSNYLDVLRRLAPLTMEERKLRRAELKKALYLDDDAYVDFYFKNEIFWTEARFFLGALTAEQQDAALHGSAITVSLASLNPEVYAFFHQAYMHRNPRIGNPYDGTERPVPEPANIVIFRRDPSGRDQTMAPAVVVTEGDATVSWMGTGGLDRGVRSAIERAWMLPGDAPSDNSGTLVVKDTKETDDAKRETAAINADRAHTRAHIKDSLPENIKKMILADRPYGLTAQTRLAQLSLGTEIAVVAVLPDTIQGGLETPVGKTIDEFFVAAGGKSKSLFHKWRDGVILVNQPRWFTEAVNAIPSRLLSRIHTDKNGKAPIAEWAELMRGVSDDQAEWLAETQSIAGIKQLRAILLLAAKYPDSVSKAGTSIDPDTIDYLRSVGIWPRANPMQLSQLRIRIQEAVSHPIIPGASSLKLQVSYEGQNSWIQAASVTLPPYREAPPSKATAP